jgi:hypothetical protein
LHNLPQDDHEAGDMKESPIDLERTVVAHNESAKVADPCERALDCPAPFVASKKATILRRRAMAVRAVRRDQQNAYATAEWLRRADCDGSLEKFLCPELEPHERKTAEIEGWILGVI